MSIAILSACGAIVPDVTPTVAPTISPPPETRIAEEPTRTPIVIFTETPSETSTQTPSPQPASSTPSRTPTESQTPPPPSETATVTPSDTDEPTASDTLTATETVTPSETATVTPSDTDEPTASDTLTATETVTPSDTDEPTASDTLTPTETVTPSETPTVTPSDTDEPTASDTLTPTETVTPSETNTDTPEPSPTPLIIEDTDTPPATNTPTVTPSETPTATITPSETDTETPQPSVTATNTPDFEATRIAQLPPPSPTDTVLPATPTEALPNITNTPTAIPSATQRPTITAFPTLAPTNTLGPTARPTFTSLPPPTDTVVPRPTLAVTPTFITATPGGQEPIPNTPIPSTPVVVANTATATPFTPTPFPANLIPPTVGPQVQDRPTGPIDLGFTNTNVSAFNFNGVGNFFFNGNVIPGTVGLFAVNPADPNSFARTDSAGLLTFAPIGGGEGPLRTSPFFDGFVAGNAEQNENFVADLAWAPDGRRLAFVIQPPPGTDNVNAGVWWWSAQTNSAFPLIRDCPNDGFNSCMFLNNRNSNWQSVAVEWSPDSTRALVTLNITSEGRQGFVVAPAEFNETPTEAPGPFERFWSATWLNNDELLVSGLLPDRSRSIIGVYNTRTNRLDLNRIIHDQRIQNIYLEAAVPAGGNRYLAFGRPGDRNGAFRLYRVENGQASAVSDFVENRPPDRIRWTNGNQQAVLSFGDQQYIVNATTGTVSRVQISNEVRVGESLSGGGASSGETSGGVPSGVIEGSRYSAGQQLQLITGDFNLRSAPSLNGGQIGSVLRNEFVTVLAGPYRGDGYEWWQVSNARNERGWVAVANLSTGGRFFSP